MQAGDLRFQKTVYYCKYDIFSSEAEISKQLKHNPGVHVARKAKSVVQGSTFSRLRITHHRKRESIAKGLTTDKGQTGLGVWLVASGRLARELRFVDHYLVLGAPHFTTIAALPHAREDPEMCDAVRSALHVSSVPPSLCDARVRRTARVTRGVDIHRRAHLVCRAGTGTGSPTTVDQDEDPEPNAAPSSSYGAAMQSVNVAGVSLFAGMAFTSSKALSIPHVEVPDIRWVDWRALKNAGFKACVFDKDNTLTVPYERTIEPRVRVALKECIEVFGAENVAVLSNSAGLTQYDPNGAIADELEQALGIGFLRHSSKKPAGSCTALEQRFKCASIEMVMLGDRYLTDVVYGNRHGMFTVRAAPFTEAGESLSIRAAKFVEETAVSWWRKPDGSKKPERCPGKKPHVKIPQGKDASHFIKSPGVW